MTSGRNAMPAPILLFVFFPSAYGCYINFYKDYSVDCQDYQTLGHTTSGVYHVKPSYAHKEYEVFCDMATDGGGWLVFQRRLDGNLDFYRDWTDYEQVIVIDLFNETVLFNYRGLRPLKAFLSHGDFELRIDLTDFEGNSSYAHYYHFDIGDITENYKLKVTGYKGTAGSLIRHNGDMFSARDRDKDNSTWNCSEAYKAAWWYDNCHDSNLNGQYVIGSHTVEGDGINWKTWTGHHYSLKTTDMKIRRAI